MSKQAGGIIRINHQTNYFIASNEPFNDPGLTWAARGVMGYLLSKPDGWVVRSEDLVSKAPGGIAQVKRIIKELKDNGYIRRYKVNNDKGFLEWVTQVYESKYANPEYKPTVENRTIGQPTVENPTVGLPTGGKPTDGKPTHIVNTESVSTKRVITKGNTPPTKIQLAPIPAALAEICKIRPELMTNGLAEEVKETTRLLGNAGVTPASIKAFGVWWYANDWRGKKGEAPKPRQVCETWGQFEERENGHNQQSTPLAAGSLGQRIGAALKAQSRGSGPGNE